ncbi:DNA protecting protein DprA [Salinibacter ruber]|jgi:DNA processing protein|uniref:DNA-processing protein DprA n=1 Tax=Salinibacter ruber TaxID=146919 RepID=UPI00216A77B7|nr:DNA-processing protein DprA [Salinibacter ruber]MCS3675231.1 DNA protecting protein DprA [Salinibacter ruber]MCS4149258.1 DNA protecting protein DprA [Salinibacter ruber]
MISTRYVLGLLETKGVGKKTARRAQKLGDEKGPIEEIPALQQLLQRVKQKHPRTQVPRKTKIEKGLGEADKILSRCRSNDITPLVPGNEDFPTSLRDLGDCPPVVYRKGASNRMSPAVAIVGTRSPSEYGRRCAGRLGRVFGEEEFWVISGLALGCDAAVHGGCLEAGGKTSAILAHGLDEIHPKNHTSLAQEILDSGGALWSEYPPGTPPRSHQYVQRNRLQTGLSRGAIIVEAGPDSGTMHTARFALEQGKMLGCLVPKDENGKGLQSGNDQLLKQGAYSVSDEEDVGHFMKRLRKDISIS